VATVEDISRNAQLEARNFWQEVVDPASGRTLKYPGGFAVINGERLPIRRGAPKVGEHNKEVYADELGWSESEIAELEAMRVI
jgi:crotonobetainyl-CoA:carnitine CoA-transferase CaiB-like acyl-CoA transferase